MDLGILDRLWTGDKALQAVGDSIDLTNPSRWKENLRRAVGMSGGTRSRVSQGLPLGPCGVSEPEPLLTSPGPSGSSLGATGGGADGPIKAPTEEGVSRSGMDSNEGTKRRLRLERDIRYS